MRRQVAILTGGKRLGVYIAHALAKNGVNIILTYLHSKKIAQETAQNCERFGIKAYIIKIDVSKETEVKKLFRFALQKFRRVDFLIAMASTFQKIQFSKLNEENWNREISNNLTGVFLCAKEAADVMLKQKSGGRIILFGDKKVGKPYAGRLPYFVAKAGVHMLAKTLVKELPKKISIHLITPGYIHLSKKTISKRIQKLYRHIEKPEEIVARILKKIR